MYFGRSNQRSITFPSKLWSRLVLLHRKLIDACAEARWRSSGSGRRSCVGWNPDNPASATFCGLHPPCPRHTHARHRRVYPPEKTKTRHRDLHTVSHGRAPAAVTPCLCAFPLWPPDGAVSHSQVTSRKGAQPWICMLCPTREYQAAPRDWSTSLR